MNAHDEKPLVSVVVPTYNRQDYLAEAIESVIEQTYDAIELLIVDDHSSESPRSIVDEFSDANLQNIEFLRHEENKGVSAARNTGIENANGELIALLDDDDLWTPDKIERQVAEFQRGGSDIGVVCSGIRSVDADGATIRAREVQYTGDITKELLCGAIVPLPSVVVRRDVLSEAGLFDERLPSYEDQEWMIRLSQSCEFRSVSDPLVISRRGNDHVQLTDDIATKAEESYPLFMEKCRPIGAEYGRITKRKMESYWLFRLGHASLVHEEYERARTCLQKAVLTWPFVPKFYLYLLFALLGKRWYKMARDAKRRVAHYRHEITSG